MSKLAEIEDYYYSKGYRGKRLEKILKKDSRYQKLLKEKRSKTKNLHKIASKKELEKYPLPAKEDFIILGLVHRLKKKKISRNDGEILEFILSQLEYDWRSMLLKKIKQLAKKYSVK